MNIALLCVLIIITGETDGFHVENIRAPFKKETGERIPLRKLHSLERDDPKEAKTVTWNQILADALVNRIKIFSFHTMTENEHATDIGADNLVTNCISQMMHLYKTLVYDKVYERPVKTIARNEGTELSNDNREAHDADEKVNFTTEKNLDPKEEVEIIEPKYHGKMCDECGKNRQKDAAENGSSETVDSTEIVPTSVSGCPAGLVASDGGCTDPKSKFILSIPYQCPIGYRRDWLGYCRPQL